MVSHGSPERLAILTRSATLPLESVARMYLRLSRVSPGTESGQGSRRCQARLRSSSSPAITPLMPNSVTTLPRLSRWRSSSLVHPRLPLRTSSMAGWYRARQRSAKAAQSTLSPRGFPNASPSLMMLERQSTTVPNTSKVSAFTPVSAMSVAPRPRDLAAEDVAVPDLGSLHVGDAQLWRHAFPHG